MEMSVVQVLQAKAPSGLKYDIAACARPHFFELAFSMNASAASFQPCATKSSKANICTYSNTHKTDDGTLQGK